LANILLPKITNLNCKQIKAAQNTFVQKTDPKMLVKLILVSISATFYEQLLRQYFFTKIFKGQTVRKEKLYKILTCKKYAHKMLVNSYEKTSW